MIQEVWQEGKSCCKGNSGNGNLVIKVSGLFVIIHLNPSLLLQDPWVREDPLEEEMETHSTILSWGIPWTEEPGGLQSTESQRVGHD